MTAPRRVASVAAPAKVNLALRVLGRRADGYHELETLLQAVDLSDHVVVELGAGELRLEIDGPDLGPIGSNLAHRAAVAYGEATGWEPRARIRLRKTIPAGAGLGGGSSDAAAVLRCLAALRDDPDRERLHRIGAGLGSDVPFFLGEGALAHATGRGEVLRALRALPVAWIVLSLPPVHVPTGQAYAALAERRRKHGIAPRASAVDGPAPRLADVRDWEGVAALAHNDFEEIVAADRPEISRSLAALRQSGAAIGLLSGSGAAAFGVFHDRAGAEGAAAALADRLGWPCVAVPTLRDLPSPERS